MPAADEFTVVNRFATSVVTRGLADSMALVARLTALSVVDSALHQDLISRSELDVIEDLTSRRRGALQVREMCRLADGRAASPLESRVRLRAHDGGTPPDDLQWPVRDRHGVVVGISDMVWVRRERRPVVGEADGEGPHNLLRAITHDRHRQNDFTGAEVDILRFTWDDTTRPAYIPSTVRRSLRWSA